jgi:hypothetical protein
MKLGAEKSMRLIAAQLSSPDGLRAVVQRATGLCFEPGATLDALMMRREARHADAATLSLYLLPGAATLVTALLSLNPGGMLARVAADLLAVAMLPTMIALTMPGLSLLFDVEASPNRYRWRTFISHALVPALIATAAARVLEPFSVAASTLAILVGYLASARVFQVCCDDWASVPEHRRLHATVIFIAVLMLYGLFSALLFKAGLVP